MECKNCGMEIRDDVRICPYCRSYVDKSQCKNNIDEQCVNKKKIKEKEILLIIISVIMCVFLLMQCKDENTNANVNGVSETKHIKYEKNKEEKEIEISSLLGKTINEANKVVKEKFEAVSYRDADYMAMRVNDSSFVAIGIDSMNRIDKLYIQSDRYTIFGIKSSDLVEKKKERLLANGFEEIEERFFKNKDSMNAIIITDSTIDYIKDYYTEEKLRNRETEKNFKYTIPTSIGHINIGNGQILEYSSDDILKLEKEYYNTVSYKKEEFKQKYSGVYVKIQGSVSDVLKDGRVRVDCGKFGLIACTISLINEQHNLIDELNMNSNICVYARANFYQVETPTAVEFYLPCTDGIITKIDGKEYIVPLLQKEYLGISKPGNKNKSNVVMSTKKNQEKSFVETVNGFWITKSSGGMGWDVLEFKDGKFSDYTYAGQIWVKDGNIDNVEETSENRVNLTVSYEYWDGNEEGGNIQATTATYDFELRKGDTELIMHTGENELVYTYLCDTQEELDAFLGT